MKENKPVRRPYWVVRRSNGEVMNGGEAIYTFSADQAVGYFVSQILRRGFEKNKFYATTIKPVAR